MIIVYNALWICMCALLTIIWAWDYNTLSACIYNALQTWASKKPIWFQWLVVSQACRVAIRATDPETERRRAVCHVVRTLWGSPDGLEGAVCVCVCVFNSDTESVMRRSDKAIIGRPLIRCRGHSVSSPAYHVTFHYPWLTGCGRSYNLNNVRFVIFACISISYLRLKDCLAAI